MQSAGFHLWLVTPLFSWSDARIPSTAYALVGGDSTIHPVALDGDPRSKTFPDWLGQTERLPRAITDNRRDYPVTNGIALKQMLLDELATA